MHTLALALLLAVTSGETSDAPETAAPRVAIVGASVSAGFGLSRELEADCDLTPFVRAALVRDHGEIANLGDGMLFLDPVKGAREQLEAATALEPDLLLAGDLAFWFGYGTARDTQARLARLERGLALLEELPCPIVLGDFPDMSPALQGSSPLNLGKPILRPEQVPSRDELVALNEHLHAWAAEHEHVHVFGMSGFVQRLHDDEVFELRGIEVAAEEKAGLLQSDLLHPTVRGSALFTLLVLDHAVKAGLLDEAHVRWELEPVEQGAWEHTRAEREKKQERRRRREERKRKLEERKREKEGSQPGEEREAA